MKATDQLERAALMKTMDCLLEDPGHNVTTIMDMLDKVAPARTALTCRNRRAPSICAASAAPSPTSGRRWPSACETTPPTRATPTAPTSPRTWPTPTKRSSPPKTARSRRQRNRTRPSHARHALAVGVDGEGNAKPAGARASPATEKTKSFIFSAIAQHPKIDFRFVEFSVKCKWHFSSQANMPEKPSPLYQA